MTFSCPELTLDEVLALAGRLGYDGVEPRIQAEHKHGLEFDTPAEVRREAREKAAEAGVDLCCIATSCRYADPETTDAMVEDTHQAIDLAADVGSQRIRVFGGNFPDALSREAATERVAEALASVAGHAAERDVVVCMETHDAWCNPEHVADVIRQVDHPAVCVNWDIMHPIRREGSTMDKAYEVLGPWVRHVHFHDGTVDPDDLKMVPIGEGGIDHKRAVELLQAAEYTDYLSGEWINWTPYEEHLPRELATMKGYEGK
jgi:sugar phosphate isomerase/epimerase